MFNSFHGDKPNTLLNGDAAVDKRGQAAIGRDELEDKYLKLQDDHLLLKKHARNQEEKLKKLTTKVTRLINDKKRLEEDGGKKLHVEKDELLQDLEDKVRNLEKENVHLKEKLLVTKQQVLNNLKRKSPYHYVPSKIDTGIARPSSSQQGIPRTPSHPGLPQYALNLLEEARDEIASLEDLVASQRLQLEMYEQGMETLREQMKVRESEHEEEFRAMREELTHGKKQHVQENIDLIKMNREVKHKSSHLTSLQAQYTDLEEKMQQSNRQFTMQIEFLTKQLEDERSNNVRLQAELSSNMTLQSTVAQLQAQIQDLKRENALLKESHDKLVNSALDVGTKNGSSQELNHLENVLKTELNERKLLLEQLQIEKEIRNKLETEITDLKTTQARTEAEKNELRMQIDFMRQEGGFDFKALEEALSTVGEKQSAESQAPRSESAESEDLRPNKSSQRIDRAQEEYASAVTELEKTRSMLMLQYKINKECREEMERLKEMHQAQMEEHTNLMQIRAARIEKLEKQMEDVVYGTVPEESAKALGYLASNRRVTDAALDVLEKPPSASDNELHVKISRCTNVLSRNKDVQPSPYCVYKFYDRECHSTVAIPSSNSPQFNDHETFPVNVNSLLDSYLRMQEMEIFVYDQKGPETLLGQAKIGLGSLAKNLPIRGTYNLISPEGTKNGTIDVSLYWQKPYEARDLETFDDDETETRATSDRSERVAPSDGVTPPVNSRSEPVEEVIPTSTENELRSSSEDISKDVVVSPKHTPAKDDSTIVVSINKLELDPSAPLLRDESVQMLFVEYKFLDFPPEELETPYALPKPIPPQHVTYNFKKVFHLARKTKQLTQMLRSDSRIAFTVVSEPPMDCQDLDCKDVGVAYVDLLDIFEQKKDMLEEHIEIYDIENKEAKIGKLTISIQALALLRQTLPDK